MTGPRGDAPSERLPESPIQEAAAPKSKPQTLRDFERALRGLGYSRSEASAIARGGFMAAQAADGSDGKQLEELKDAIRRIADVFNSER